MNNLAAGYPVIQTMLYMIGGFASGFLVNYLADVLPTRRRLCTPFCLKCEADLPLVRYLALQACVSCGTRRKLRAWIVMVACLIAFVWFGLHAPERLGLWGGWFWLVYLLLVTVIDIEHHLILHIVAAFGALVALYSGVMLHGWVSTIIGGIVGALVMLAFYLLGIGYARWSARRHGQEIAEGEALGFGDVTFSGVMGLLLGWPGVIGGLMFGILFAGAVSLVAILPMIFRRRYNPNLALPYGPFLAAAIFYLLYLR